MLERWNSPTEALVAEVTPGETDVLIRSCRTDIGKMLANGLPERGQALLNRAEGQDLVDLLPQCLRGVASHEGLPAGRVGSL